MQTLPNKSESFAVIVLGLTAASMTLYCISVIYRSMRVKKLRQLSIERKMQQLAEEEITARKERDFFLEKYDSSMRNLFFMENDNISKSYIQDNHSVSDRVRNINKFLLNSHEPTALVREKDSIPDSIRNIVEYREKTETMKDDIHCCWQQRSCSNEILCIH